MTRRPHPPHSNPISAPVRVTVHSWLPQGCGFLSSTRSPGAIDIKLMRESPPKIISHEIPRALRFGPGSGGFTGLQMAAFREWRRRGLSGHRMADPSWIERVSCLMSSHIPPGQWGRGLDANTGISTAAGTCAHTPDVNEMNQPSRASNVGFAIHVMNENSVSP